MLRIKARSKPETFISHRLTQAKHVCVPLRGITLNTKNLTPSLDTDFTGYTDFKIYFQFPVKLEMFQSLRESVSPRYD